MESSGSFSSDYMAEGLTSHLAVGKHPQESSWTYCSVCHNNSSTKGVSTCPNPNEECVLEDPPKQRLGDLFQLIGTFMNMVPKLANVFYVFNEKARGKLAKSDPYYFISFTKGFRRFYLFSWLCFEKTCHSNIITLGFHCKETFALQQAEYWFKCLFLKR